MEMAVKRDTIRAGPEGFLRTRRELERAGDAGYFGPASAIWQVNREAVLGLGLGRAVLLQIAHPCVAQALLDFSDFQHRPTDRTLATIEAAQLLVFGSRAQADAVAARIRMRHAQIRGTLSEDVGRWRKGTQYRADDPEALLWVLVTLIDTALRLYEWFVHPLRSDRQRAYLSDAARLGALLGVPPERVPSDRPQLDRYLSRCISDGTVAAGAQALRLARDLRHVRLLGLPAPLMWPYRAATLEVAVRFLPPALRPQFGPVLRQPGRLGWRALVGAARVCVRRLPPVLRTDPIAHVAVRRWARAGD